MMRALFVLLLPCAAVADSLSAPPGVPAGVKLCTDVAGNNVCMSSDATNMFLDTASSAGRLDINRPTLNNFFGITLGQYRWKGSAPLFQVEDGAATGQPTAELVVSGAPTYATSGDRFIAWNPKFDAGTTTHSAWRDPSNNNVDKCFSMFDNNTTIFSMCRGTGFTYSWGGITNQRRAAHQFLSTAAAWPVLAIIEAGSQAGDSLVVFASDGTTKRFSVAGTSGNTAITGTLGVTGATALAGLTATSASLTTALPIASGGTNNGSLAVTAGGIVYMDGSRQVANTAGTSSQCLKGGTTPSFGDCAASTPATLTTVYLNALAPASITVEGGHTIKSNFTVTNFTGYLGVAGVGCSGNITFAVADNAGSPNVCSGTIPATQAAGGFSAVDDGSALTGTCAFTTANPRLAIKITGGTCGTQPVFVNLDIEGTY